MGYGGPCQSTWDLVGLRCDSQAREGGVTFEDGFSWHSSLLRPEGGE